MAQVAAENGASTKTSASTSAAVVASSPAAGTESHQALVLAHCGDGPELNVQQHELDLRRSSASAKDADTDDDTASTVSWSELLAEDAGDPIVVLDDTDDEGETRQLRNEIRHFPNFDEHGKTL